MDSRLRVSRKISSASRGLPPQSKPMKVPVCRSISRVASEADSSPPSPGDSAVKCSKAFSFSPRISQHQPQKRRTRSSPGPNRTAASIHAVASSAWPARLAISAASGSATRRSSGADAASSASTTRASSKRPRTVSRIILRCRACASVIPPADASIRSINSSLPRLLAALHGEKRSSTLQCCNRRLKTGFARVHTGAGTPPRPCLR